MGDKINSFFKKFNDNVQDKMDKILVDKVAFQTMTQQNEQLNQRITGQEDDFNLQYRTFQSELQNLGKKICSLESEKQVLLRQVTELKHSVAASDNKNRKNDHETLTSDSSNSLKDSKNEFDDELKRLKHENGEKARNISKLMAERMKTEADYCSKIERLNTAVQQRDKLLAVQQQESDRINSLENRIAQLLKDLDFERQENSRNTKELHSLTKTCQHRKTALDDLAIETQKEVKSKNEAMVSLKQNIDKLNGEISGLKNEDSNKEQALGLAQKQGWQKAREIDALSQKVSTLEHNIKGLDQQKHYLESVLQSTESKYKDFKISTETKLSDLKNANYTLEISLGRDLEESMEHNKRLRNEIEQMEKKTFEVPTEKIENGAASLNASNEPVLSGSKEFVSRELREARSRAMTAEKKIQQLQRDMSKQLNLERKRSENLSKKLETMQLNHKDTLHPEKLKKATGSVSSRVSVSSNKSVVSSKSTNNRDSRTEVELLRAEILGLKSELFISKGRKRTTSTNSQISNNSQSTSILSSSFQRVKNVLKSDEGTVDPIDQLNFKSLNAQLTNLLQDEMLQNQALRDNISDLSEQLATALDNS